MSRLIHRIFIGVTPEPEVGMPTNYLLLEDGNYWLLENGNKIKTQEND